MPELTDCVNHRIRNIFNKSIFKVFPERNNYERIQVNFDTNSVLRIYFVIQKTLSVMY